MSSLIDSVVSHITPALMGQISKALGADESAVSNALRNLAALLLTGAARKAGEPAGAAALHHALAEHKERGFFDMLKGAFGGSIGQTGADQIQALLGVGVNSMVGTLARKSGFNLSPLLGLVTPALTHSLSATVREKGLDAAGLGAWLSQEAREFEADPANAATVSLLREVAAAGAGAELLRQDYPDEEWRAVRIAPTAALLLVATASPSGPMGAMKEMAAASHSLNESLKHVEPVSLLGAAFGTGMTGTEIEGIRAEGRSNEALLAMIKKGYETVGRRNPPEAAAYRQMILDGAKKLAEATTDGGFLGFGAKLVSDREAAALQQIEGALA